MKQDFYPKDFPDPIKDDNHILIIKPFKDYDPSEDLKKLILDKREVCFTYPKEGIDLFSESKASEALVVLQIGKPCTRKLPYFDGNPSPELLEKIWMNLDDKFINYHHHDEYSMRDALGTCKQLAVLLKAQKRRFMSVTNHGSIGGWIKQMKVCKENDIKCVFGMEAYHSPYRGDDPEIRKQYRSANHLILIAQNIEGYYNLIRIHNDAQLNGFYYSPRTCDESLKKWGKGLKGTTACMAGELSRLLKADKWEEAEARYRFYEECFDEFYIEIQLIEMEEQKEINLKLIKLAQKVGAKMTIGIDSHYLYPEQSETHDLLMCIRQHRTVNDVSQENDDTWQFSVKNLFYRDYEQLYDLFKNGFINSKGEHVSGFEDETFTESVFKEACMNTRRLTVCADDIKLDTSIKLPKLYEDSEEVLRQKAWEGFRSFGFDSVSNSDVYKTRLEYELDVICLSGWADYFLITKMIIDEAIRLKGEFGVGWGRGCFLPSNKVKMGNGFFKEIQKIKKGDTVLSHDGTENQVLVRYSYLVAEEMSRLIFSDGREIECTKDHRILQWQGYGNACWVKANNLKAGDSVCSCDDHSVSVIKRVESFFYEGNVFDLCVENTHTYNIEGLSVHNSACGSLVSYCIKLTFIDPIKYDLLFERFLDFSRSEIKVCTFEA